MGTRHLIMVISNKQPKVAQYGQWDGYPSGQGATILNFLKKTNLKKFKERVDALHFANEEDEKEMEKFMKSIGCENGWMNMEQSELYQKEYMHLSRDAGAGVLNLIMGNPIKRYDFTAKKDVSIKTDVKYLHDSSDFAADSLFCEWAYVIDLDKNTLEVYTGFNKKPLGKTQRFYPLQKEGNNDGYYPVRLKKKYSLSELPDENVFLAELEPHKFA